MELVYVAIITTVGGLIGLLYLDKSFYRRLEWKKDYEKSMLQLKKREGRKDKKLAAEINISPPAGKMDTIKNLIGSLDNPAIQQLISQVSKNDDYEEQGDDIVSTLIRYGQQHPELVQRLLQGLTKGKSTENDIFEK
jgi:hypothetical protein